MLARIGAIVLGAAALVAGESRSPADAQRAISLLSKPSTERIPFSGSRGSAVLAVGSGGRAAIVLRGFAPALDGEAYHAWVLAPGERPVRAGVFAGTERVVLLSTPVERGASVGITSESSDAVIAPTARPRGLASRPY